MVNRVEPLLVSQVPFPENCCPVTLGSQQFGKSHLQGHQPMVPIHLRIRIDHPRNSCPLLIPSRQKSCPGRTANTATGMKIGEPQPFGSQSIQVRCLERRVAVTTGIPVTHVVGHDNNQVRPFRQPGTREARTGTKDQGSQNHSAITHHVLFSWRFFCGLAGDGLSTAVMVDVRP